MHVTLYSWCTSRFINLIFCVPSHNGISFFVLVKDLILYFLVFRFLNVFCLKPFGQKLTSNIQCLNSRCTQTHTRINTNMLSYFHSNTQNAARLSTLPAVTRLHTLGQSHRSDTVKASTHHRPHTPSVWLVCGTLWWWRWSPRQSRTHQLPDKSSPAALMAPDGTFAGSFKEASIHLADDESSTFDLALVWYLIVLIKPRNEVVFTSWTWIILDFIIW